MDFMDTNHSALPFPQQRQPRSADPVPREHIGQLIAALPGLYPPDAANKARYEREKG